MASGSGTIVELKNPESEIKPYLVENSGHVKSHDLILVLCCLELQNHSQKSNLGELFLPSQSFLQAVILVNRDGILSNNQGYYYLMLLCVVLCIYNFLFM